MKKVAVLFLCILPILAFSGCFPSGEQAAPESTASSGASGSSETGQIPKHLERTLETNLQVDADVDVPADMKFSVSPAKLITFDADAVAGEFLSGKNYSKGDEHRDSQDPRVYGSSYTAEDGSTVFFNYNSGINRMDFDQKKYEEYDYGMVIYGKYFIRSDIAEIFTKPSIDNVDKEQAIQLVQEKIAELKIPVAETPEVYALDVATLLKEQEKIKKEDEQAGIADSKVAGAHQWVKEDQAYVIVFRALASDGKPVTSTGYMASDATGLPITGSRIMAVVGVDGLLHFEAQGIYETEQPEKTDPPLISVDQALEQVKEKYKNVILTSPVHIEHIALEYVPQYTDVETPTYKFSPVWVLTTAQAKNEASGKNEQFSLGDQFPIYIDAVTGKEIAIGGLV